MPFFDTLIVWKTDGRVKLLVYRKKTHTDQYLHFSSHHPLQHKLSVVRTLLDRSSQIVTEVEDRKQEEHHIHTALARCDFPRLELKSCEKPDADTEDKDDHAETNLTSLRWTQVHSGYSVCAGLIRSCEPSLQKPRYCYSHETIAVDA